MSDAPSKQAKSNPIKAALNEDYEVEYFMNRYNLSKPRVLKLITKHGGDRKKIENEMGR
ncbi:DUF3606 domain-containing protein [Phyllobacterium sp. BT25]|uniref:DUF3606 domain-containing protein n=1 Tax=Phyllobacterium pellucidum TaxID=2740464 RepID=A0A849VNN2_9HYPH|nr:DUF3606 domain-containing protein [Phyllobacterium pellucidum]NTS30644.1 DUF3606 domain-containing protein [Phyllobacterium pellucidum]